MIQKFFQNIYPPNIDSLSGIAQRQDNLFSETI